MSSTHSPSHSAALSFGFVFPAVEHSLYLSLSLFLSEYLFLCLSLIICHACVTKLCHFCDREHLKLDASSATCGICVIFHSPHKQQAASSAAEAFNCSVHLSSPAVMFHMLFVQCVVLQVPSLSHSSPSSTRSVLFLIRSVDV